MSMVNKQHEFYYIYYLIATVSSFGGCFVFPESRIIALWFINYDYRVGGLNKFNGFATGHPVMGAVYDIGLIFLCGIGETFHEGVNVYYHYLDIIIGGKAPHLAQLL